MDEDGLYYIHIIDHVTTEETSDRDSSSEWSRNDTEESHSIQGFEVAEKGGYRDLSVAFKPDKDTAYYLLYVLYDTGDSFHRECGKIEFVGFYQTKGAAEENKGRIQSHYDFAKPNRYGKAVSNPPEGFNDLSVGLVTEGGTEYTESVPWTGYFENLVSVEIKLIRQER